MAFTAALGSIGIIGKTESAVGNIAFDDCSLRAVAESFFSSLKKDRNGKGGGRSPALTVHHLSCCYFLNLLLCRRNV
ncbi:MAG: hypothetical protein E4G97_05330 [Deltaproteobacteria bacterium]|nr:MAG: hypothetical protein E4G97_05330 [Deltaproteobacteria bacterium]